MIIHADVSGTPDCPTFSFRQPISEVNLDTEIPKILKEWGWSLGTYFNVQFIKDDRTKLIASGRFIVTEEVNAVHTANAESYSPNTREITSHKFMQIGDWFYPKENKFKIDPDKIKWVEEPQVLSGDYDKNAPVKKIVKWNPGKKVFQVKAGDNVVFEHADKVEAEKFRDAA